MVTTLPPGPILQMRETAAAAAAVLLPSLSPALNLAKSRLHSAPPIRFEILSHVERIFCAPALDIESAYEYNFQSLWQKR